MTWWLWMLLGAICFFALQIVGTIVWAYFLSRPMSRGGW